MVKSTNSNRLRSLVLLVVLLVNGSLSARAQETPSNIPTADSTYFVPATGQQISSASIAWWTTHNGATLLGMPLTAANASGLQIFEFGSLNRNTDGELVAGTAGLDLAHLKYGNASSSPTLSKAFRPLEHAPSGDSVLFDEATMHSIKGGFARAYTDLGGESTLGPPISEPFAYGGGRIQWFENAALIDLDGHVSLAPIGRELAMRSGIQPTRDIGGLRPVFLDRYQETGGDGTLPDAATVFAPVAFQIPSIGIDAVVENVPIIEGVMQVPEDVWAVGWYYDLPAPGQYTNVVMAAHRDWWGVGPVVFYNLDQIQVGDMIYLWDADGVGATYQVTAVTIVDAEINAGEVVQDKNADTLTLITCGGAFDGEHYLSRIIVESVRV